MRQVAAQRAENTAKVITFGTKSRPTVDDTVESASATMNHSSVETYNAANDNHVAHCQSEPLL